MQGRKRYEIIIHFHGAHSSTVYECSYLGEVNEWLKACYDETVKSADVRDTITKTIVTYNPNGSGISKASFIS